MASAVANRYASALVDVVTSAGSALKPEDAVAQLRSAAKMVADSAELRNALMTPAIQNSRKRAVIGKLLDSMSTSHLIRNFIFVIIDHRRIAILDELREAFELLLDARMRIGSTVYDGSLRGQLQQLRRQLTGHSAE